MILVDVIEAVEKVVSGGSKKNKARLEEDNFEISGMVSGMQKLHVGANPSN
jgi:hypothetical protein